MEIYDFYKSVEEKTIQLFQDNNLEQYLKDKTEYNRNVIIFKLYNYILDIIFNCVYDKPYYINMEFVLGYKIDKILNNILVIFYEDIVYLKNNINS